MNKFEYSVQTHKHLKVHLIYHISLYVWVQVQSVSSAISYSLTVKIFLLTTR